MEESISPFRLMSISDVYQPRTDLCASLFDLLQRVRIVYARGTPTCGKSTLGRLFHNYVNKRYSEHGKMALFVDATGRVANQNKERNLCVHDWLQEYVNQEAKSPFEGCQDIDAVPNLIVIIDEGQAIYNDGGFWESPKDNNDRTHYLILCSWGSPTATSNKTHAATADLLLPPSQRVGFSRNEGSLSMLFTPQEHQDAIRRYTLEKNFDGFHLSEQTIEYLYELTNGHPGATDAAFQILYEVWVVEIIRSVYGNMTRLLTIS